MSGTPYIPFYTSDFLGGTSGMTAATKGVYITLLCLMYEADAPLPQSWDTLARRCGSTLPAFKKAIEALQDDGKVTITDAGIWSEKCEKHLALRRDRQSSAKAAAKTRWQKTQQKQGKADATASIPQCQPEPEPEPDISNISKEMYVIPSDEIAEAVSAYNAAADRAGWPKVQKLTTARRSSLKARIKDVGGIDGWSVALSKAEASDFLCARTPQGFTASFDFLTRQSSFAKLMEGNYDNRTNNAVRPSTGSGTVDAFAAVAARLERGSGAGNG